MEIETIKNTQRETTLEIENLGETSGVRDSNITNRMQEIEEKTSEAEDTIGNIYTTLKDNVKCKKKKNKKKTSNPNHPGDRGHNEKIKPKDNISKRE